MFTSDPTSKLEEDELKKDSDPPRSAIPYHRLPHEYAIVKALQTPHKTKTQEIFETWRSKS